MSLSNYRSKTISLEVKLDRDTVWLNQQQLADLYGTKRQAITKHIANIYECEELEKPSTSSILEQVRKEGNRMVTRKIEYYNLDMIISVGYRVNTKRGIQFRQWANSVLKDYLLRGYSVNRQYPAITYTQLPHKEHDRFLIIDQTVFILGDSLKDLGHSMTDEPVLSLSKDPQDHLHPRRDPCQTEMMPNAKTVEILAIKERVYTELVEVPVLSKRVYPELGRREGVPRLTKTWRFQPQTKETTNMINVIKTAIEGVVIIEPKAIKDARFQAKQK